MFKLIYERIVSFNVNRLRSAVQKGFNDWLKKSNFDIVCLQETKMDISYADPEMYSALGYTSYTGIVRRKKGYSGVLILSREKLIVYILVVN